MLRLHTVVQPWLSIYTTGSYIYMYTIKYVQLMCLYLNALFSPNPPNIHLWPNPHNSYITCNYAKNSWKSFFFFKDTPPLFLYATKMIANLAEIAKFFQHIYYTISMSSWALQLTRSSDGCRVVGHQYPCTCVSECYVTCQIIHEF